MPALGTHVIQSRRCLEQISPKVELDRDFVGASAVSHDAMSLLPTGGYFSCFEAAHQTKTDEYFLTLIRYIKKHKMREHSNAMAFLYGQIMHYALDTKTHPLIYYMTTCHPAKFYISALDAHTLFEAWYDVYRENILKQEEGENYNPKYAFVRNVGEGGIDDMIDDVYDDVYDLDDAAKGYKYGIKVWEFYQMRLRGMMLKHVKKYHSDFAEMLNPGGGLILNPVTNAPMNSTFEQAYEDSITLACELIKAVDANIYDGAENEDALKFALGKSYDTGEDWRNPDPKRYFLGYRPK